MRGTPTRATTVVLPCCATAARSALAQQEAATILWPRRWYARLHDRWWTCGKVARPETSGSVKIGAWTRLCFGDAGRCSVRRRGRRKGDRRRATRDPLAAMGVRRDATRLPRPARRDRRQAIGAGTPTERLWIGPTSLELPRPHQIEDPATTSLTSWPTPCPTSPRRSGATTTRSRAARPRTNAVPAARPRTTVPREFVVA